MTLDLARHPCFNSAARGTSARIHLPVALSCNVQCNYCDRRFDCLNESRPGVTSAVLTPRQALHYLEQAVARVPSLSVVGIAGPGDPFASPNETLETLSLVRERFPEMLLCIASNGLAVEQHADELARLQVSHVTITVNAVDPAIGAHVYAWVRDGYRVLRGEEAARTLLEHQLAAIQALKSRGITVKINTILMPGINEGHAGEVARTLAALGADIMNCIPMYPVEGTPFATLGTIDHGQLAAVRKDAATVLPQMMHCTRCRADAVGLLGEAQSPELINLLRTTAAGPVNPGEKRPYIAVASHEGLLVNQHLGEAKRFWVVAPGPDGIEVIGTREAPDSGIGAQRWYELAATLHDCGAVFVTAAGQTPKRILERQGVRIVESIGLVSEAVEAYARTGSIPRGMKPVNRGCGHGCTGDGAGC
jgi:nitrogen fixation protein NifB